MRRALERNASTNPCTWLIGLTVLLVAGCGGDATAPRDSLIRPMLVLHLPVGVPIGDTAEATLSAIDAQGFQADVDFSPAALRFLAAGGDSGDIVAVNADSAPSGLLRVLAVRTEAGSPMLHLTFEVLSHYDSTAVIARATALVPSQHAPAATTAVAPRAAVAAPALYGDLTGNGVVDALDVYQAARAAVGLQISGVVAEPLLSAVANVHPQNSPGIGAAGDTIAPGRDADGVYRFNALDVSALAHAAVGLPNAVVRQVVPAPQLARYNQLGIAAIVLNAGSGLVAPNGRQTVSVSCRGLTNQPIVCPPLSWTSAGGAFALNAGTDTAGTYVAGTSVGIFPLVVTGGSRTGATTITIARPVNVTITPAQTFQTWEAWEHASTSFGSPPFTYSAALADSLVRFAVAELGQNRIRLQAAWNNIETDGSPSGVPDSPYLWKNDNPDPKAINPAGFRWTEFDDIVRKWVLPLRTYAGSSFRLNLNIVAMRVSPASVRADSAEYAEFGLAVVQHLKTTFGLTPDDLELMLEPTITGTELGQDLAALRGRLAAAGFGSIKFIGPSLVDPNPSVAYARGMMGVAGAGKVNEISYHRYTAPAAGALAGIAQYAAGVGASTSMLEHIGADERELYDDLTQANVSAWQRYVLAGPPTVPATAPEGKLLYVMPTTGSIVIAPSTYPLRQYMKYIHTGDVRVGAASTDPTIRAVAFRRPNGSFVVVANTTAAATLSIGGLPGGSYQTTYSTAAQPGAVGVIQTIATGGVLPAGIPAAGVITLVPVP